MAAISRLMSNRIILLKRPYISLIIATRGLECEKNYRKLWPGNLFQLLTFTLDPFFSVNFGHLSTKAFKSSYITDPNAGDNCCGSGLVSYMSLWKFYMLISSIFQYITYTAMN